MEKSITQGNNCIFGLKVTYIPGPVCKGLSSPVPSGRGQSTASQQLISCLWSALEDMDGLAWKMAFPKRRPDSPSLDEVPENSLPTGSPQAHPHPHPHGWSLPPLLYTGSLWHPGPTFTVRRKQNKVVLIVGSTPPDFSYHPPLLYLFFSSASTFPGQGRI